MDSSIKNFNKIKEKKTETLGSFIAATSDLHALLFNGVHFLALGQWQQVAHLVHPSQEVLSQALPSLVGAGATCTSMQTQQSAAAHLILLHLHVCVLVRHIPDSDSASSSSTLLSSLDLKSRNWRNFNNLDTFCYKGEIEKKRLYDTHFSNLVDLYIFFRTISALK